MLHFENKISSKIKNRDLSRKSIPESKNVFGGTDSKKNQNGTIMQQRKN